MSPRTNNDIEAWEGEGGAMAARKDDQATPSNTLSHAEWTQRMKHQVTAKFNPAGRVISIDCKKTKPQPSAPRPSAAADDSIKPLGNKGRESGL